VWSRQVGADEWAGCQGRLQLEVCQKRSQHLTVMCPTHAHLLGHTTALRKLLRSSMRSNLMCHSSLSQVPSLSQLTELVEGQEEWPERCRNVLRKKKRIEGDT
jgi:hypothetical protein